MKISRSDDETARRLREALQAQADTVQPADAWSTITDRLDRRPSPWSWITQRPVLIAGAVVLLALVGFLAISQLGGGDDETQVEVVDDPPSEDYALIAVTQTGGLIELDSRGRQERVIDDSFVTAGGDQPTRLIEPLAVRESTGGDGSILGDVLFLAEQPASDACDVGSQILTGVDYAPIDGQDHDRDPRPLIDPATTFALSPSGDQLASVSSMEAGQVYPADPRCAAGSLRLQISDREGLLVHDVDIPEGLAVRQLAWLDEDRLAVAASEQGTATDVETLTIEVLDLRDGSFRVGTPSLATDRSGLPAMPGSARMTATPDGQLVLAGPLDDAPFDAVLERGAPENTGPIVATELSVWVGDPESGSGEQMGAVELSAMDLSPPTTVPHRQPLTLLTAAGAPDGSVLLTVATTDAWLAGFGGTIGDPADVALFRIPTDGATEKLSPGILSIAVRPGDEADLEPEPTDEDAGPVVGARADGSLALLDPATGEVAEELDVTTEDGDSLEVASGTGQPEVAVAPDGTVYLTSTGAPPEQPCAEDELTGDWVTWAFDPVESGPATPFPAPYSEDDDAPPLPARLASPSPDGTLVAFVTTSSGEICDGALSVFVSDLRGGGMVVGNHTLPVGVEPTQLLWGADGQLIIGLPVGDPGAGVPELNLVSVDPLASGPVSMGGEPLAGRYRIASGAEHGYITVIVDDEGIATVATRSDATSDAIAPPAWTIDIPADGPRFPVSLAEDRAGTVWVTFAEGEPGFQSYGETFSTWRIPVVDGEPGVPEQVSDELTAVAATPFEEEGEEEPTSPTTHALPTTGVPPATTAPVDDPPSFLYVTPAGAVVRQVIGGPSETVAELGSAFGYLDLAVHPDGSTLYLSADRGGCESALYALGLADGQLTEMGMGAHPAVSPDGSKLAYIELGPEDADRYCPSRLVVRDLATGTERRWTETITDLSDEGFAEGTRLVNLSWASDNRTLALAAAYEADTELLVDTDQPEGDLVFENVEPGPLPVRDPSIPHAEWWLVGTADVDGKPAVVVEGSCYAEDPCDGADLMRFVPLDGSPTVDLTVPADAYEFEVGPEGLLFRRMCEPIGCLGDRVVWLPIGGTERELLPDGVVTAAWLP